VEIAGSAPSSTIHIEELRPATLAVRVRLYRLAPKLSPPHTA